MNRLLVLHRLCITAVILVGMMLGGVVTAGTESGLWRCGYGGMDLHVHESQPDMHVHEGGQTHSDTAPRHDWFGPTDHSACPPASVLESGLDSDLTNFEITLTPAPFAPHTDPVAVPALPQSLYRPPNA